MKNIDYVSLKYEFYDLVCKVHPDKDFTDKEMYRLWMNFFGMFKKEETKALLIDRIVETSEGYLWKLIDEETGEEITRTPEEMGRYKRSPELNDVEYLRYICKRKENQLMRIKRSLISSP